MWFLQSSLENSFAAPERTFLGFARWTKKTLPKGSEIQRKNQISTFTCCLALLLFELGKPFKRNGNLPREPGSTGSPVSFRERSIPSHACSVALSLLRSLSLSYTPIYRFILWLLLTIKVLSSPRGIFIEANQNSPHATVP